MQARILINAVEYVLGNLSEQTIIENLSLKFPNATNIAQIVKELYACVYIDNYTSKLVSIENDFYILILQENSYE